MLLNLTYQELERVECNIKAHIKNKDRAKQESKKAKAEKLKEENAKYPLNALSTSIFFIIFIYCSTHNADWKEVAISIVIALIFSSIGSYSPKPSNESVNFSDENIAKEMLNRLKTQYFCESDINFLNFLYHKDILNKAEKERIDEFLASKGKGILNYLSSLGERELEMFAKPYKEQIAIDIEQAVCGYYENKSKQEKSLLELVKA